MKHFNKIFLVIVMIAAFTGCKKYDEGPLLSLRSKKERVSNVWKIEKLTVDGFDDTAGWQDYKVTFTEEGDYSFSSPSVVGLGRWTFQDNKNEIRVSGVNNQSTETLYILKLKEDSFWYYIMDGNLRREIHLVPAD